MQHPEPYENAEEIKICKGDIDYQGIVRHINDGIVIIREGVIVFANEAFYEISGKTPEQVLKADFAHFINPSDRARVANYFKERFFSQDTPDRIEFLMPRPQGDAIIEMKSRVVECGGAPGLLGALTDITERRQTRIELQRIKERMESILNAMNEAIISLAPDGAKILAINPAVEALYGVPVRDFRSGEKHTLDFVHPEDFARVQQFYNNLPTEEFRQEQYRIISNNKKLIWVLDEGHVVYGRGGIILRIDHVIKDITEEKNAIDGLTESEAKYRDFFNSTSDMAFAISPEGVFIDINDAGLKLLGFTDKEEALGSNVTEFYVDINERKALIKETYGKGHVVGRHIKFKNRNGEPLEVAITARVKRNDEGKILHHEGIIHNISKALEDQRNRVLRNAAGGMCHYLNTHLMQLEGSEEGLEQKMEMLKILMDELNDNEDTQRIVFQMKNILESMAASKKGIHTAFERLAEVTNAFSKAFLYKEEPYANHTILDIFNSYGYDGK